MLPQIDEVVIGDEDRLDQNSYQNQTPCDPSQSIDDISAELTIENLMGDDDDSGDANAFEEEDNHANGFEDENEYEDEYDQQNESTSEYEVEHEYEDEQERDSV